MNQSFLLPYFDSVLIEAGCDEAGRGPLAGPLFAAAVILPKDFSNPLLDDSKKLSPKIRYKLREIIEKEAVARNVVQISVEEIDKINILNAAIKGMQEAVAGLDVVHELLLIDGNRFKPFQNIPHKCVVHGDAIYASIAAASVIAKTYRDDFMKKLASEYPEYGWDTNMGYAGKKHIEAIKKFGYTPHHRKTFKVKSLESTLFDNI